MPLTPTQTISIPGNPASLEAHNRTKHYPAIADSILIGATSYYLLSLNLTISLALAGVYYVSGYRIPVLSDITTKVYEKIFVFIYLPHGTMVSAKDKK